MNLYNFFILFFVGFLFGLIARLLYAQMSGRLGTKNLRKDKKVRYISPKLEEPLEPDSNQQEPYRKRKAS